MDESSLPPPHVLILPLPMQGPVNSMLKLAQLLCLGGLNVTFFTTTHILNRLLSYTNCKSRFSQYPGFQFEAISDGLPEDHPRSALEFMEMFDSLVNVAKPLLKEMLTSGSLSSVSSTRPVTCIIADGLFCFAQDVANDVGIPFLYFDTISASCLWVYFCMPNLIEDGELPFKENDLDKPIRGVSGMEGFLRRRDLPHFCRATEMTDPNFQLAMIENQHIPKADGLILNTFEELEGPSIHHLRCHCENTYAVGPLHVHLKTRLVIPSVPIDSTTSTNSLWKEERGCLEWLDAQPPKSVIFVSFGSLTVMTKENFMEFWHGLVNSKQRFLWVIRSNFIIGQTLGYETIGIDFSEGKKGIGYIVRWAPQEEVLGHPAIGGFLTHSGWNSTLESIATGVPMLCWPGYVDQHVNSRFVSEVWKVGIDMKDTCDRKIIEKLINELMETKKDEFMQSANQMANLAKESVSGGGSSYCNLDRLINYIRIISSRYKYK